MTVYCLTWRCSCVQNWSGSLVKLVSQVRPPCRVFHMLTWLCVSLRNVTPVHTWLPKSTATHVQFIVSIPKTCKHPMTSQTQRLRLVLQFTHFPSYFVCDTAVTQDSAYDWRRMSFSVILSVIGENK